jgi:hypothetical protein
MAATALAKLPIHRLSYVAFGTALVSGALALYGAMHAEKVVPTSPLRAARGTAGQPVAHQTGFEAARTAVESNLLPSTSDELDARAGALAERSQVARYGLQALAFVAPFGLGLLAALAGGEAMKAVQGSEGKYGGNTLAVFATMVGGLAAVVAGCMILSVYVWPHVPSLYTL